MSDVVLNNRGESMLVLPDFVVNMDRVVCAHMNHGDEKERLAVGAQHRRRRWHAARPSE